MISDRLVRVGPDPINPTHTKIFSLGLGIGGSAPDRLLVPIEKCSKGPKRAFGIDTNVGVMCASMLALIL